MVLKNFINILLLLVALVACTSAPHDAGLSYVDFPQTQDLKGKVIPLDTALFRYPFRIRVQGDRTVVMDLHGTDYFCQVFSYPEGRYLSSFGKRGDSPEEMVSVENIRWNGELLFTLDAGKSEITQFELALSGSSPLRKKTVKLNKDILRALDFVQYDDSAFIIPDYSGDSRLCLVNRQGRILQRMGAIPSANEDALKNSRPALAQAWRSFIDYNPGNGVLATVTQLGEVLEVYNLQDSTHVVRIGPHGEPEFQVSQGYGIPTGIMGFSDV